MKKDPPMKVPRVRRKPEPDQAPPATTPPPREKPKRFHTSVYLEKEFYKEVKIALLREGEDRDFNRLVNDLLLEWYEEQSD